MRAVLTPAKTLEPLTLTVKAAGISKEGIVYLTMPSGEKMQCVMGTDYAYVKILE